MNKISLAKRIAFVALSTILVILTLVFFIKSYSFYSDEEGTSIAFNEDYLVGLLALSIILGYAIFILVRYIKTKDTSLPNISFIFGTSTLVVGGYSFGKFFKVLFKAINKKKQFDYIANQYYLYAGIIFLAITIYLYIIAYKKYKAINK